MRRVFAVEPSVCRPHWMLGAATMLMDRMMPVIEEIRLPRDVTPGGTITITHGDLDGGLPTTRHGLRALRHRFRDDRPPEGLAGPIVDMRFQAPENFSHALLNHVPLCALVRETIGPDFTAVLPALVPGFIKRAFALCGISVVATDHAVRGDACRVQVDGFECMINEAGRWVRGIAAGIHAAAPRDAAPLPSKVLLARRGTRAIANQVEIEAMLHPLGYTTLYPEDLSVPDQFRLFDEAADMIAVHGAGLAPLVYRNDARAPLKLIEIFPAAHMANLYRVASDRMGGRYVAVRGRITREDAAGAYAVGRPYVANSLKNFEVDPASLHMALDMMASGRDVFGTETGT